MKKIGSFIIAIALVISVAMPITVYAYTPKYTNYADSLHTMGLFMGSDKGYELDRQPTRTEALIMLIRLLGEEDAAKSCTATQPFTDVPQWASHYVAYAYERGYTKGSSANKFGVGTANAAMFCTFVLRALEYSDVDGDFSYSKATDMAGNVGIIGKGAYQSGTIYRDDCVLISYNALSAKLKNSDQTLLDHLIASGAVDENDAVDVGLLTPDGYDYFLMTQESNFINDGMVVETEDGTIYGVNKYGQASGSDDVECYSIVKKPVKGNSTVIYNVDYPQRVRDISWHNGKLYFVLWTNTRVSPYYCKLMEMDINTGAVRTLYSINGSMNYYWYNDIFYVITKNPEENGTDIIQSVSYSGEVKTINSSIPCPNYSLPALHGWKGKLYFKDYIHLYVLDLATGNITLLADNMDIICYSRGRIYYCAYYYKDDKGTDYPRIYTAELDNITPGSLKSLSDAKLLAVAPSDVLQIIWYEGSLWTASDVTRCAYCIDASTGKLQHTIQTASNETAYGMEAIGRKLLAPSSDMSSTLSENVVIYDVQSGGKQLWSEFLGQ